MATLNDKKHGKKGNNIKINSLIKKLTLVVLLFSGLFIFCFFNMNKFFASFKQNIKEFDTLNRNLAKINSQIRDTESKSIASKRYIEIWKNEFPKNKKITNGLNIEDLRKSLEALAKRNSIFNLRTSFTLPEQVTGIYSRNNIRVISSVITVNCESITDINIYNFIDEIENILPGFFVLESMQMKKIKKIDKTYLDSLASGKIVPSLSVSLRIRAYALESIKRAM